MAHKWKHPHRSDPEKVSTCLKCGTEFKHEGNHEVYRAKGAPEFTRPAHGLRPKCIDAPKGERRYTLAEIGLAVEAADRSTVAGARPAEAWLVAFWSALHKDQGEAAP